MRASRLLALLLHLQANGGMTAEALARELEVSVRTIYRDVEALGSSGVPVYAESGPGGGIRLVDGWRTRLTGITAEEADALLLAGAPGPAAELGLGTVLAAAQLKVLAALPPELRSRAGRVRERFLLDAPGWFQGADPVPHLPALAEALWDDRRIDVSYRRADKAVQRRLDPLGLVLKAGVWYLLGRHRRDIRTYRVSRIERFAMRSERFVRPATFDLAAAWSEASAGFEESVLRMDVDVRVLPRAWRAVLRALDPSVEPSGPLPEPDADGWIRARLRGQSVEIAAHQLFGLGAAVVVEGPPDLRDRVRAAAVDLAGLYG